MSKITQKDGLSQDEKYVQQLSKVEFNTALQTIKDLSVNYQNSNNQREEIRKMIHLINNEEDVQDHLRDQIDKILQ